MPDDWAKTRLEAEIAEFKNAIEDASVEYVDVPDGRKGVEIAFQSEDSFEVEEGVAIGVYFEPDRRDPYKVHIDWEDGERTTVKWENIETLEEGEY